MLDANGTKWNGSGFGEKFPEMEASIISDKYKTPVVALGAINSSFAILVNFVLLTIILSDRGLRRSVFVWNVFSLCVSGLISGIFIVPLNTSRFDEEQWVHGETVCKILVILDHVQLTLPAIILAFTNLNRIYKVHRDNNPLIHAGCFQTNLVQYVLLVFPWVYSLFICVPILLFAKSDDGMFESIFQKYCFFIMKIHFVVLMLAMMMILPLVLLCCAALSLALYYYIGSRSWNRLTSSESGNWDFSDIVGTVRSTVLGTLAASLIFLVCWMPDFIVLIRAFTCHSVKCQQHESTFLTTYTISCSGSFFSQVPWFFITDIRLRMHELMHMLFSSLRHSVERMRRWCCLKPLTLNVSANQSLLVEGSDMI